jgi:hypothetical protein
MDNTRRAFWQFAMAGGAASIWGHYPDEVDCVARFRGDYPSPEQLHTHLIFWRHRFLPDMEPADNPGGNEGTLAIKTGDGRIIFYTEDSESIQIDLTGHDAAQPAIAVDTAGEYIEIDLGNLAPEKHSVALPRRSDWAIAVGTFPAP